MKNTSVFYFELIFFSLASLGEAREGICSPIYLTLLIINPKMIPGELLGLPDLFGAQVLYIHKPTEVIMID